MKELNEAQMGLINGGDLLSSISCGVAIAGFAVTIGAAFTITGPAVAAAGWWAAGHILSVVGLTSCFSG